MDSGPELAVWNSIVPNYGKCGVLYYLPMFLYNPIYFPLPKIVVIASPAASYCAGFFYPDPSGNFINLTIN